MVLRRVFFRWLFPAAFVLPLWLFVGWIVFGAGSGWALLWLFIAIPAVFVSQLLLTLLVRARASVRTLRAVSWWDILAFGLWHLAIVGLGFFDGALFFPLIVLSVVGALATFWAGLAQVWREARGSIAVMHTHDGTAYIPPAHDQAPPRAQGDVIVVTESPRQG